MKNKCLSLSVVVLFTLASLTAWAAYHHEGEIDSAHFLAEYPQTAGTKLDHCATCHSGGEYEKKPGVWIALGSCQWCHYHYGYDGQAGGTLAETLNPYGTAYMNAGRDQDAVAAIAGADSDQDGHGNAAEIAALSYPGDDDDTPDLVPAPYRIYTRAQLEGMGALHTQFMLMNASRSDDKYVQYSGIPMQTLLANAGMMDNATSIVVYAPDGWSQFHPLEADDGPEMYWVNGTYPQASYFYDAVADMDLNANGWCDYSAPSCTGRFDGDVITNTQGLKMILAWLRDGVYLTPGVLNLENKLDGEGPFRVVPPQRKPGPPDQRSFDSDDGIVWPYDGDEVRTDHNAGAATRSVTIIKVEPLPEGTTDIDVLEAGWDYVDTNRIIIYGAIDGTDSNGNGVLDSEEDLGTNDHLDPRKAAFRHPNANQYVRLQASAGAFIEVAAMPADDPDLPAADMPGLHFPYGVMQFKITGLANAGDSVTVTITFPEDVPADAELYKVTAAGWAAAPIPFQRVDGDARSIRVTLTDGDAATDADGVADQVITDPSALAVPAPAAAGGGGGSSCFIDSLLGAGGR